VTDDDRDPLPARMLNEWVYCPRLAILEHVHGEWRSDEHTEDGRRVHRRVDQEQGEWPQPGDVEGREVARSLWLTAHGEGITARLDLVEATGDGDAVRPVDYKRGAVPDVPELAYDPERVQVCAQALVLREHGYGVTEGAIWFAESRQRVRVPITDALVMQTRQAATELRAAIEDGVLPPPLRHSPKCNGCSLAPLCLPDELTALQCEPESLTRDPEERLQRRLVPARDDALPLHVTAPGSRVGIGGQELVVSGKSEGKVPLAQVSSVALYGGVHITGPAQTALASLGVPLAFFSQGGWFYGMTVGLPHGNVLVRRAQFAAAADPAKCLLLARRITVTKIRNQRHLLRRNAVRAAGDDGDDAVDPEVADALRQMAESAEQAAGTQDLAALLGCEGMAAKAYFSCFGKMLRGDGVGTFDFMGRNRRPPADPVNACLSFAYAMLARELTHVLWRVGLDPLLGFLHQPRHGRAALALDLMEEFRPIIGDSVVLTAINQGELTAVHFITRGPSCNLTDAGRRKFIAAYERRMDHLVTHPVFGYRISYRRVLEVQARLLGRHLLGEIDEFPAFEVR
jgi:CRISPR-associated endonuclease Cas1/CRISPR-associated protein Cas4